MIQSLFSGVSGMLVNQDEMDQIGNNIANANTTGFKTSDDNFSESFVQLSRSATDNQPLGLSAGLGVAVTSTSTNFSQGVFQNTNVPTDMGINGSGFFTVQSISGVNYVTRNGSFVEDSNGFIRTPDGAFLMGVSGATAPTSPTTGFPPDQLQIPATITASGSPVVSFAVDSTGAITATGSDGSTQTVGFVTLQSFNNNNGLVPVGNSLYEYGTAAGTNQYFQASVGGAGTIQTGVLEASNTDLSAQFADMIIAQRGFEASARVITVSDNMLQTITNLKQQ